MKQADSTKKGARKLLIGVAVALAVYLLLLALASLLIVRGALDEVSGGVCAWIAAFVSAFAGAAVAGRGASEKPMLTDVLCAAALWLIVQLIGFLTNDTLDFSRSASIAAAMLCGGFAACLLHRKKGKRAKRGRHSHK